MLLIVAEKGLINITVEFLKHSENESLARMNKSGFDDLHVTTKEGHGVLPLPAEPNEQEIVHHSCYFIFIV
ncbi:ankyrin repeat-containing protein [Hordeum vulgare]|nr:ankyrin repeat-containing protein [Hordeum vulgare]